MEPANEKLGGRMAFTEVDWDALRARPSRSPARRTPRTPT